MKGKKYKELLEKANELSYSVNSLTQYVYDTSYADKKYAKELEMKKVELSEVLNSIEDILTISTEEFDNEFMGFLNDDRYELTYIHVGNDKLHVAKPKDLNIVNAATLIENENVYLLGVNDFKVISRPAVKMEKGIIPTVSILKEPYFTIYMSDMSKHNKKYQKFSPLLAKMEYSLVAKYEQKKTNSK